MTMDELKRLDSYEIVEQVRRGQSADTYRARHMRMKGREVLLRVLHEDAADDEDFVREFVTEARNAARLQHDCIAGVFGLEVAARPIYAVLEMVDGRDLSTIVGEFGPLPPEVAAAILVEVARGLEYAHGFMLHRRLRPRQIKVRPDGQVKILGFGMRNRQGGIQPTVNIANAEHEELFRSPEQVRELEETPASDVFSLGVIFFEILSGKMPYPKLSEYVSAEPSRLQVPRLRRQAPLVPAPLASLIERMLAGRPGDRISIGEVQREALDFLESETSPAGPSLLQQYLADPRGYTAQSRRNRIKRLLDRAERLAKGSAAEREAAVVEARFLLDADPGLSAAQAMLRRLGAKPEVPDPSEVAFDPDETLVMPASGTGGAGDGPPETTETKVMPPARRRRETRSEVTGKRFGPAVLIGSVVLVLVAGAAIAIGIGIFGRGEKPEPPPEPEPSPPPTSRTNPAPPPPTTGSVFARSKPRGATITLVESGSSQVADATFEKVPAGSTHWHAKLPGYLARDTVVEVAAGRPDTLVITLEPVPPIEPCSLYVHVRPRADQVLIDGLLTTGMGDTVFWTRVSRAGNHSLEVRRKHYVTWTQQKRVMSLEAPLHWRATMVIEDSNDPPPPPPPPPMRDDRTLVTVRFIVTPRGEVVENGNRLGTAAPELAVKLPPGEHRVRIENPDFAPVERSFKVETGKTLKPVRENFADGNGRLRVTGLSRKLRVYVDGDDSHKAPEDVLKMRAGWHDVSVRDGDGKIVGSKRVLVDPHFSGVLEISF